MLKWYYYVLFAVVTFVALSMTWYSMMDLGASYLSLPVWLAVLASLAFDGGGIFLGLLAIEYAKTEDSGFWTELGAYLFIGTSVYIVVQHAVLADYPIGGIVFFAAAPVIVGIMLKALLSFLTRQARRDAGRVVEKLPSVGWLTWVRYLPQSWKLMSVAMQGRLVKAADKLVLPEDRHGIFGQAVPVDTSQIVQDKTAIKIPQVVQVEDKKQQQLSEPVRKPELTSGDKPVLPVWLPQEPDMKLATLARTCLDNGVMDIETIYRYAVQLKGQDVNKASLTRTLTREKQKI